MERGTAMFVLYKNKKNYRFRFFTVSLIPRHCTSNIMIFNLLLLWLMLLILVYHHLYHHYDQLFAVLRNGLERLYRVGFEQYGAYSEFKTNVPIDFSILVKK